MAASEVCARIGSCMANTDAPQGDILLHISKTTAFKCKSDHHNGLYLNVLVDSTGPHLANNHWTKEVLKTGIGSL